MSLIIPPLISAVGLQANSIAKPEDVNEYNYLYYAATSGDADRVQELAKQGANVNRCIQDGHAPLFVAASFGHKKVVEVLLQFGVFLEIDNNGMTALMGAAKHGHGDVVEILVKAGANINRMINGSSALWLGAIYGHVEVVRHLVLAGANVKVVRTKDRFTPLHAAVDSIHLHIGAKTNYSSVVEVVDLLLKGGADVNAVSTDGWTPLALVCVEIKYQFMIKHAKGSYIALVNTLLQAGAAVNGVGDRSPPLYVAANFQSFWMVKLLLKLGANVNIKDRNNNGGTPLAAAALQGNLSIIEELLRAGADVNVLDDSPVPLLCGTLSGYPIIVEKLLHAGANVNAVGKVAKKTALLLATEKQNRLVVQVLLQSGANANIADKDGSTPLCIAAANGDLEMVNILLQARAKTEVRKNVESPLWRALWKGHTDVVGVLIQAGAFVDGAMHSAIQSHHTVQQVKMLVKEGINVHTPTSLGPSFLAMALQHGIPEVVDAMFSLKVSPPLPSSSPSNCNFFFFVPI